MSQIESRNQEWREEDLVSDRFGDFLTEAMSHPQLLQLALRAAELVPEDQWKWDEGEIMLRTRYVLEQIMRQRLPIINSYHGLAKAYVKARDAKSEYYRFAHSLRLSRVQSLQGDISNLKVERRISSLQRGILKRVDRLGILNSEDYIFLAVRDRVRVKRVSPEIAATELVQEIDEECEKLTDQAMAMINELEAAVRVLGLNEEIIGVQTDLVEQLALIGGPMELKHKGYWEEERTLLSLITDEYQEKRTERSSSKKKKNKKKRDKVQKGPSQNKVNERREDPEMLKIESSVAKMREALAVAEKSGGKLRMIVPDSEHRGYFENKWRQLLEALGYGGRVEFVCYQELARKNSKGIPVVLSHNMNTHSNLWKYGGYQHVFVLDSGSQNQMIHLINSRQS